MIRAPFVARERPRLGFGDVFVRGVNDAEGGGDAVLQRERVHALRVRPERRRRDDRELSRRLRAFQPSAAIFLGHRRDAADEVAEIVRQVRVVAFVEPLPREIEVGPERRCFDDIQPQRIRPESRCRFGGIDRGPQRLAHALGSGSFAAISIAGQITAWKRVMSLPMTCTSAGHHRLNFPSSSPKPTAEM